MTTEPSGAAPSSNAGAIERSDGRERCELERRLVRMYEEILGIEGVGVESDFFALGGQSLKAMQLLAAINEAFCAELQFGDLVDKATPRALAQSIESVRSAGDEQLVLQRRERSGTTFMTRGQLLFWRLGRRPELASYFNLRQALMLHGPLGVEALRASLQALSDRHESLRLHFFPRDDSTAEVELIIPEQHPVAFSLLEVGAAAGDPTQLVQELLQKELEKPFDLLSEPLIRFKLVRFSPVQHALLITMHHLITDAWSFNVLRRELNVLYSARVRGRPDTLPPLAIRYSDFADWNHRLHQSGPYRQQRNYWDDLFASLGSVNRPGGNADGLVSGTGYADLSISEQDFARVTQRSAAHSTTPYVLLQSFMHLALYSTFREQQRMLVLAPAAERHRSELQDSIGLHITIVGVLSAISAQTTLRQFIAQLKRSVHQALEHHESRQFALYDLGKHRHEHFPLFVYNYFVLQNDCPWGLDELRLEPVMPREEDRRAFVTMVELYHARGPSGLWGQLKYDLAQFGEAAAARFIGDYRRIVEAVLSCTDDDVPIDRLIGR